MDKRKALGRGLGALIPNLPKIHGSAEEGQAGHLGPMEGAGQMPGATAQREYFLCPIEEIIPSVDNPRHLFDEQRLQELADSIKTQGLVQPLVVRLRTADDRKAGEGRQSFVLIAGERRWRAAQRAGMKDVPVVVKDVNAARAFELALVENLQREDLNAIEEAEAYRRLSDEFGYTQEELAHRVGRDRATVANSLRLLKLPGSVRDLVARDELSMGHARALLGLENDEAIQRAARRTIDKQLSVRQTEQLVRREKLEPSEDSEQKKPIDKTAAVRDLEERLQKSLGTRVRIQVKDGQAGRIEIDYHSLDHLDGLLKRFLDRDLAG